MTTGPEHVSMTFHFDPNNPVHEATRLGIMAMADQVGIVYNRALQAPDGATMPGEDYLLSISSDLYGTDLYGYNATVALGFLTTDRETTPKNWPEQPDYRDVRTLFQKRKYSEHRLHGNLGRTMNVLLASVDLQHPTARDRELERLSLKTIEDHIRTNYTSTPLQTFQGHVNEIIKTQLVTGAPSEKGELLIGGRLTRKDDRFTFEEIERESLAVIARHYGGKRQVAKWLVQESYYK